MANALSFSLCVSSLIEDGKMNIFKVIDDLFLNKILLKQHMYSAIRSREHDNALKILTTDRSS